MNDSESIFNKNARFGDLLMMTLGAAATDELSARTHEVEPHHVRQMFDLHGAHWGQIVEADVRRIARGQEPRHFLSADRFLARYRRNHGIPKPQDRSDYAESNEVSLMDLIDGKASIEEYHSPLHDLRGGLACWREQEFFYESQEWEDCAAATRYLSGYTCEFCGARDTVLQAHHQQPIYSVFSMKGYRNFDQSRLMTLCRRCHHDHHRGLVKRDHGFQKATPEEKLEERHEAAERRKVHDEARECKWCRKMVWN